MNPRYEHRTRRLPSIIELIDYLEDLAVERGRLEERLTTLRNSDEVMKK